MTREEKRDLIFRTSLFLIAVLILILFSAATSCKEMGNSPRNSVNPEKGTTTVTEKNSGKIIRLRVSDILQIELLGTPSTGSWWHFVALNQEYLEIIEEHIKESNIGMVDGGPVLGIWQLRAKRAGTTTLEMAYYRTCEKADTAGRRLRVIVKIEE